MSSTSQVEGHTDDQEESPSRRDFIHLLAGSAAGLAGVALVGPAIHQMNPDASVLALSTKEVDISGIEVGQAIKVFWQGKPVFIRHRTEAEITAASETPLSALKDGDARNDGVSGSLDAADANRVINPAYLVVVGVCTHLGCIPLGTDEGDIKGDFNGWFCPCHGSHYDESGRIRKGPAPDNMTVPPYTFVNDTTVKIG